MMDAGRSPVQLFLVNILPNVGGIHIQKPGTVKIADCYFKLLSAFKFCSATVKTKLCGPDNRSKWRKKEEGPE